jgi:hypothetical protein
MAKDLEYLRSKRYWALILLGPPLRAIFAFAVFAALHLGLGLPWPTHEDAGILASLLEMFGFLAVLEIADRFTIRMFFGPRNPRQDEVQGWAADGVIGMFAAEAAMVAGYAIVLIAAPYLAIQPAIDFDNSAILMLVLILSTIHYAEIVQRAGRRQPRQPDGAEGTDA